MEKVFHFREPVAQDGMAVHQLIADSPPLDQNSVYCNLLQCTHFAGTCVVAEFQGQLAGFTSAYLVPGREDTLFVWQMVVAENARGKGLAGKMLVELLQRPDCSRVTHLETTIMPDNDASWLVFEKLAKSLDATCKKSVYFESAKHFNNQHADEHLLRISSSDVPFHHKIQIKRELKQ